MDLLRTDFWARRKCENALRLQSRCYHASVCVLRCGSERDPWLFTIDSRRPQSAPHMQSSCFRSDENCHTWCQVLLGDPGEKLSGHEQLCQRCSSSSWKQTLSGSIQSRGRSRIWSRVQSPWDQSSTLFNFVKISLSHQIKAWDVKFENFQKDRKLWYQEISCSRF